jgi:dephospho-CoA kinase
VSKWPGKYVIGLTGNIATGKSVVRKMLEHLGAYGIDADTLAHRAIAKGAPGYLPVLDTFGRWILTSDLQIDRGRLARVVFSDAEALARLEAIVHPLVSQAVNLLIQRAPQNVIAIEAIKLLESDLRDGCDAIWVSYTAPDIQIKRLVNNRKMSEEQARQRILSQPSQEGKIAAAQVVINNNGSFEETWRQVLEAWQTLVPEQQEAAPIQIAAGMKTSLSIRRGGPRDSEQIASLINRLKGEGAPVTREDIMAAFGEKAFLLLEMDSKLVGIVGWQVENLVARTSDIYIDPRIPARTTLPVLMTEVEHASKDLQSEASLLFVPQQLAEQEAMWKKMGYERRTPENLGVLAWEEAARESMPDGSVMFFKQLRANRILRPI